MFCCFPGAAECGLKVINGCNTVSTWNPSDGKLEVILLDERRTVKLGLGQQRIQVTATADVITVQRFTLFATHEILNWMGNDAKKDNKKCLKARRFISYKVPFKYP